MRNKTTRRSAYFIAAMTLLTAFSLVFGVLAQAETVDALASEPIRDNLAGNRWGGSSHLYQVQYPGGNVELVIQVESLSTDVVYSSGFGFNVYGPYGYEESGGKVNDGAFLELSYNRADPAVLTVQVYNYINRTVPYEVRTLGLAPEAIATAPADPEPIVPAEDEGPVGDTVTGVLVGNGSGNYATHMIQGNAGEEVWLTLEFTPLDNSYGPAFGYVVYGPDGKQAAKSIEHRIGYQQSFFTPRWDAEYTVQIYNYAPGAGVAYTLSVTR